jgi:hypothetical protein
MNVCVLSCYTLSMPQNLAWKIVFFMAYETDPCKGSSSSPPSPIPPPGGHGEREGKVEGGERTRPILICFSILAKYSPNLLFSCFPHDMPSYAQNLPNFCPHVLFCVLCASQYYILHSIFSPMRLMPVPSPEFHSLAGRILSYPALHLCKGWGVGLGLTLQNIFTVTRYDSLLRKMNLGQVDVKHELLCRLQTYVIQLAKFQLQVLRDDTSVLYTVYVYGA